MLEPENQDQGVRELGRVDGVRIRDITGAGKPPIEPNESINDVESQNHETQEDAPFYANNKIELFSAFVAAAALGLNSPEIANLGEEIFIGHLAVFVLIKDLYKYGQEGEYSRKDLVGALGRIAAPFLAAGAIENAAVISDTLTQIDQMLGFSQAISATLPKIQERVAAAGLATAALSIAFEGLIRAYRAVKDVVVNKVSTNVAYAKSYELQNPFHEVGNPVEKFKLRSPIEEAKFKWPFKLRNLFRPKNTEPPEKES